MINSVNKIPIYELLSSDSPHYYKIPKYQRAYTWSSHEWEALYDDIGENDSGYFMGSIICILPKNENNFEVIDGQQRITTLCLFLTAIYSHLKERESELSDDQKDDLTLFRRSLACKKSPNGMMLVPQMQSHNLDDFNYLMYDKRLRNDYTDKQNYFAVRKIYKCYEYFYNRLSEEMEGGDAVSFLFDKYEKVKNAILVKIDVNSHADAYVLFESLNNRGAPLTAIDLMKNIIVAQADLKKLSIDDCFNQWKKLLAFLTDEYSIQERFFRQYYNAFKHQLNEPFKDAPLGTLATRSNLLKIFKQLIENDLPSLLSDILICGKIYSRLILNDEPEENKSKPVYRDALVDLDHIQGAPSYLLLMYLLRKQTELAITDKHINQIVQLLCKYFVRRNLTNYPGTSELTRMFMEIISRIEHEKVKGKEVMAIIENMLALPKYCASDEVFKKHLEGNVYEENTGVTRYILCKLAEKDKNKEKWTNFWERDKNKYVWSIEHIFPQGDNIPKCWVDMIADGNEQLAKQHLEQYVHKLGNLTLTGYNASLSNKSFAEKRDHKDKDGHYNGYRNGLSINKDIASKDYWTVKNINARTKKLVKKLMTDYKLSKN